MFSGNLLAQFVEPEATIIHEFTGSGQPAVLGGFGFGWAVSELTDIDGDGVTDLVAGDNALSVVYVYSGATGNTLFEFNQSGRFGFSVADAGDVNADGIHDIIAGATIAGNNNGQAHVYSGADGALLYTFTGEGSGDNFGYAVASAGDVNGDGRADVIVGANKLPSQQSGQAYVYSGLDGSLIRSLSANTVVDGFGSGIGNMGDVNNDGIDDAIVGAQFAENGAGRAYVFSGADGNLLYEVLPDTGSRNFGVFFVAGVGDVNADGVPDGYVGDFGHASTRGQAYVFSGVDGSILFRVTGNPGDGAGPGRGAGDVNADGHADVIVGFFSAGRNFGRVGVYSGADGSLLEQISHTIAGAQFGFDAVGVGDLNNDGRFDYLVSAPPGNKVYAMAGNVDRPVGNDFLINGGIAGNWYNPATSGQGLMIDVLNVGERQELFVAWFTHDISAPVTAEGGEFGSDRHRWFTAQGPFVGHRAELTMILTTGGQFDDPATVSNQAVGRLILEFESCTLAQASYEFSNSDIAGSFPLSKLLPPSLCEALQ